MTSKATSMAAAPQPQKKMMLYMYFLSASIFVDRYVFPQRSARLDSIWKPMYPPTPDWIIAPIRQSSPKEVRTSSRIIGVFTSWRANIIVLLTHLLITTLIFIRLIPYEKSSLYLQSTQLSRKGHNGDCLAYNFPWRYAENGTKRSRIESQEVSKRSSRLSPRSFIFSFHSPTRRLFSWSRILAN